MTKKKLLEEFKKFAIENGKIVDSELTELDWYDMSIGWFLAKGASLNQAVECALDARYKHEYWC